jgi:hypothetical protein
VGVEYRGQRRHYDPFLGRKGSINGMSRAERSALESRCPHYKNRVALLPMQQTYTMRLMRLTPSSTDYERHDTANIVCMSIIETG